uniref:PDZ domain-containing protein n=1 Tax=Ditylenchus dipsaci TaxID=166011 RepID=A0A915D4I6_9BILA
MGNTSSSNDLGSRPEYLEKTFMVKVHTEKLRKRGVLNGLSFEGDDYDKLGSLKVSRLSSYHKLASEGGLKVGDHIIAINNYKVRHQNLVEAVQHLLSCVSNQTKIYLEVHRPAPAINEPNYVDFFGSFAAEAPVKLLTFVISRELNVGLGMTVGLEKGKVGLFIKQISKNGCAAKNGRLMVGDEIVQLNGVDLTWQYPDCVEALVKKADCVKITVRRNVKNIGTNALLNVKTSNGECFATPMYHATNSYNNPQTGKKDKQKGIKVGGVPNQLNEVGKVALERMQAGDFCKQVTPFSLDSFAQMSMDEKPQKGLKKGKHIVYVDFEETRAECLKKKSSLKTPISS